MQNACDNFGAARWLICKSGGNDVIIYFSQKKFIYTCCSHSNPGKPNLFAIVSRLFQVMSNNKFITYPVKRDLNVEWEKFSNMITHKGENSRLDSRESKNFRREFIGPLKRGRELSCIYLSMEMNESADELLCVERHGKISMKAFNPRQSKVDLFVTTGTTFLKTWSLSESADEWKNGYIESPEEKECIQFIKKHPNEAAALILSKNDNSFKIVWS
ncbi:hypothetical protein RhiirA5_423169 [Rhizophagus irregularis]|uniref:Uncharacterized protein n=1 Tax=Rhizophagus irregularis TaxID=588596 RepID=A0A2I1EA71_9GLOM|nr:hypothetical protein RhiirA5_423169 [Rhizophagus irregularis]PKY19031.1 hypothetical protein RhiirB3_431977 [Rhizophagus irregularis]